MVTRIVFQRKPRCLPLMGIKNGTKLHLVMFQWVNFEKYTCKSYGFMHDTLFECALQMYEVLLKCL